MEAAGALAHLAAGRQQGISEGLDLLGGLAQHVQSQPLGRARADAGQALELINQSGQGAGEAAQGPGAVGGNLGVLHGCGEAGALQGRPLQLGAGEFHPVGDGAP